MRFIFFSASVLRAFGSPYNRRSYQHVSEFTIFFTERWGCCLFISLSWKYRWEPMFVFEFDKALFEFE